MKILHRRIFVRENSTKLEVIRLRILSGFAVVEVCVLSVCCDDVIQAARSVATQAQTASSGILTELHILCYIEYLTTSNLV